MRNMSIQAGSEVRADEVDLFVESAWLAEHLDAPGVRIVEVDVSRAAYEQGHIPGAILWNAYADMRHADYSPLDREEFEALCGRSGLTPNAIVVFYSYGSYLGFWLLKAYGHERVLMLNGTRGDWRDAGLPWTTYLPKPATSTYALPKEMVTQMIAPLDVLQDVLHADGPIILDVRSDAEFAGERFWPSGATEDAGRPGHIPGAVHLGIDRLRTEDGAFKHAAALRKLFLACGLVPERSVVTYCTIGNRASEVAFSLKYLLGYPNVRVYYGSWAEWGTRTDKPIET
ncbi:MAG: rhodanese-like domain-containing protein [Ktedonobacterales bacterium]